MTSRIKLRRDTAANWAANNPTLALGEPGIETDSLQMKIGDGETAWTGLDYLNTADGQATTESGFTAFISDWSPTLTSSVDGVNWTPSINNWWGDEVYDTVSNGRGSYMSVRDMAVGNGRIVYITWDNDYDPVLDMDTAFIWTSENIVERPTRADFSPTVFGTEWPVTWNRVRFVGGYFIAVGIAFGPGPNWPVFAYSTDGIAWTQGTVDYDHTDSISQANGGETTYGLQFNDVAYSGTGWLFNMDWWFDGAPAGLGESTPGGYFVTSLSQTLNDTKYDADTPGRGGGQLDNGDYLIWNGNQWVCTETTYNFDTDATYRVHYNNSANPINGSWIEVNLSAAMIAKFGTDSSYDWETGGPDIIAIDGGDINGTYWTVMGFGDGQVLSTANWSTFYGTIPNPVVYNVNTVTLDGTDVIVSFSWDAQDGWTNIQYQGGVESGTKVVFTGATGATQLNGTFYIEQVNVNDFKLWTDAALTTAVDGNAWGSYNNNTATATLSRGYEEITSIVVADGKIIVANYEGRIYKASGPTLASWTEVFEIDYNDCYIKLTHGTVGKADDQKVATHSSLSSTSIIAQSGDRVFAGAGKSKLLLDRATGFQLGFVNDQDFAYPEAFTNSAEARIGTEDWYNGGESTPLDVVIETQGGTWVFGRDGQLRIPGPIVHHDYATFNGVTTEVTSSTYTTAATMLRNFWNGDQASTPNGYGYPSLAVLSATTDSATYGHNYYLPPGEYNGQEITLMLDNADTTTYPNQINVWMTRFQIEGSTGTNTCWRPFQVWVNGNYYYPAIAKAIWYQGRWIVSGNSWAD